MVMLRPHDPALPLLTPLMPVADLRRGSAHPLAWRGGDYRDELRAAYRQDRGIFAGLDGVVICCEVTRPVLVAVFAALGIDHD